MFVNFAAILATLGPDAAFRLANGIRPPSRYLFETILPEQNRWTYNIDSGNMTVRSTMAGLVGTDSAYPPGGMVEASTFLENTAKIAVEVGLTEAQLRQMQEFLIRMGINGTPTTDAARDEVLNFLEKVIVQPLMDTAEWLRGQALFTGAINWTFNKKSLVVSYGIPAGNILATRTIASGNNYAGATSKFWDDVKTIRRILRRSGTRALIAHGDTIDEARYNPVNNMVVTSETDSTVTFRRVVPGTADFTADATDTVTIVRYDEEAEVMNPADTSTTLRIPFALRGKLVGVGNNTNSGFRVGEGTGSTDNPTTELGLGYTHVAPTVEGGGRPGRWAQLYTPQNAPWELRGRGAMNLLPVIESPDKIVIATTEMSP